MTYDSTGEVGYSCEVLPFAPRDAVGVQLHRVALVGRVVNEQFVRTGEMSEIRAGMAVDENQLAVIERRPVAGQDGQWVVARFIEIEPPARFAEFSALRNS